MVVWITGLSGAGKSTLAKAVAAAMKRRGVAAAHLDGDALRMVFDDPSVGHDRESRLKNARRVCRMAALLESQGLIVVVSTMSLFHEIHSLNRALFDEYLEVLLDVDLQTLQRRDPKGHYRKVAEGKLRDLAGLDLEAELPKAPHLVLDNRADRRTMRALTIKVVEAALGDRKTARVRVSTSALPGFAQAEPAAHSERPIKTTPASTSAAPIQRASETGSLRKSRPAKRSRRK